MAAERFSSIVLSFARIGLLDQKRIQVAGMCKIRMILPQIGKWVEDDNQVGVEFSSGRIKEWGLLHSKDWVKKF